MEIAVTKVGQSEDARTGLACAALDVQVGDVALELPALSATHADYDHAARAGISLNAGVFNYYHRHGSGYPVAHKATQDNIESKLRAAQKRHRPPLTVINLEHAGSLDADGLEAFHALQVRLGLPIITTVERNPMQGLGALREELEAFDGLETDQERFPTISVRCDPEDFEEKLLHIVKHYRGFNLQWGGYGEFAVRWETLSTILRGRSVWCNVVGILTRERDVHTSTGQTVRTTEASRALLYGGHTYCFAWPHYHPPTGAADPVQTPRSMLFRPETWCYEPHELEHSVTRTMSFNAIQAALGEARAEIVRGTLYSGYCGRRQGLREVLAKIPGGP